MLTGGERNFPYLLQKTGVSLLAPADPLPRAQVVPGELLSRGVLHPVCALLARDPASLPTQLALRVLRAAAAGPEEIELLAPCALPRSVELAAAGVELAIHLLSHVAKHGTGAQRRQLASLGATRVLLQHRRVRGVDEALRAFAEEHAVLYTASEVTGWVQYCTVIINII